MVPVKIATYNCKHFKGELKKNMCKELLDQCDFLLLQEHWLYEDNFHRFDDIDSNFNIIYDGKSAMDPTILRMGRPYGGCAIIWKSNILYNICPIKTVSNRLNCINVKNYEGINFLLFNVYMPTDSRRVTHIDNLQYENVGNNYESNFHEYQDILAEISVISRNNDSTFIMIGGDFNTDMNRNTLQTDQLKQFCDSEFFIISDLLPSSSIEYTFECKSTGNKTFIDHMLITENMQPFIKSCSSYDSINNVSDHLPVILELDINCEYLKTNDITYQPGIAWYKVTIDDVSKYKTELDIELNKIKVPIHVTKCKNFNCKTHFDEIEVFHNSIVKCCINAGQKSFPSLGKGNSNQKVKAGWNEYCKEKREISLFWHEKWKNEGRPHNSHAAIMRRRTRLQYHYAVRCIEKNENIIKSNRIASELLKKPKTAWKNCQKLRGRNNKVPNMVDNVTGDKNISNVFSKKNYLLLNSVGIDPININNLKSTIETGITNSNIEFNIESNDVLESLKSLASGKSDGYLGIYSDHLLYGTDKLFLYIAKLFKCMLTHGYTPSDMRVGTIIPIAKNKRMSMSNLEIF